MNSLAGGRYGHFGPYPFMLVCSCSACILISVALFWLSFSGVGLELPTRGHPGCDECAASWKPGEAMGICAHIDGDSAREGGKECQEPM